MRIILLLLIGFPLAQVSSFGEDTGSKTDQKSPPIPAAPHYWDANSWDKGAAASFWRAYRKNKSINTSTVLDPISHAQSRKPGQKQSSPIKGG
tara:strand:+ start:72 stop:350 length:279 start_codon:yes stop_codon:yes gene_type:complete